MPPGVEDYPDPPDLWPENVPYWNAWISLHELRPEGMNSIFAFTPDFIESWARHYWCLDVGCLVRRCIAADKQFRLLLKEKTHEAEERKMAEAKAKAAAEGVPPGMPNNASR